MSVTLTHTTTDNEFVTQSVAWIAMQINTAIEEHGSCIIGLSGGSTPKPIYDALGEEEIDWSKVHLFLIDERYVPADHAESNQKMIRDTLLANATIPDANIAFPNTSLPIDECLADYSMQLQMQWADYLPDIAILGMGNDGHIASLFPPVAPHLCDDTALVAHTTTDQFAVHDRITLTLNPIACAGKHLFLLKGAEKKQVWDDMTKSEEGVGRWPAKALMETGDVTVIAM